MKVTTTTDNMAAVMKSINELVSRDVLVGIPASTTERDDGSPMNNATLGYIHEHGSPAANIPARPFLAPGVKEAQEQVTDRLGKAGKAALAGQPAQVDQQLNAAGLIAQNAARSKINTGEGFDPLAESTIAGRLRRGRTGTKPLIDTGQLRNSITYVLRKK